MVIVLESANFSQNNIGQIEVPYISIKATEMISHLTSGVYSQERFWAFGKFVDALDEAGLLDIMNWMSVPSLAKNIPDSYTNLIDGTVATNAATATMVIRAFIMVVGRRRKVRNTFLAPSTNRNATFFVSLPTLTAKSEETGSGTRDWDCCGIT